MQFTFNNAIQYILNVGFPHLAQVQRCDYIFFFFLSPSTVYNEMNSIREMRSCHRVNRFIVNKDISINSVTQKNAALRDMVETFFLLFFLLFLFLVNPFSSSTYSTSPLSNAVHVAFFCHNALLKK